MTTPKQTEELKPKEIEQVRKTVAAMLLQHERDGKWERWWIKFVEWAEKQIDRQPDAALAHKAGCALEEIIHNWPEDTEWKPVQSLSSIDGRMCFPVEAILAGQDLKNCKDYILRDVVELLQPSTPPAPCERNAVVFNRSSNVPATGSASAIKPPPIERREG